MPLITKVSGDNFAGIDSATSPPNSGETEKVRTIKGRLAFLDLERDPEKDRIQKKLESLANPPFTTVLMHEEGEVCCFVLLSRHFPGHEAEDVFEAVSEFAQSVCNPSISRFRKYYTAEQFLEMNEAADFRQIMKKAAGYDVSSAVLP